MIALLTALSCGEGATEPTLPPLTPVPAAPIMEQVRAVLVRDSSRLIDFRRDLHRNPELSGAEVETARKVTAELRRLGFEVRTGIGGHGVTGILRGARPGPLVAYRADMDAFADNAPDPVEFRSLKPGVRHICGHDIHTTVGVALAAALHQVRDSLAGAVMFVFQPAEERATGANAMLADGIFSGAVPSEIYGLHTTSHETGRMATTSGPMMFGIDYFDVIIDGSTNLTAATDLVRQRIGALGTVDDSKLGTQQPQNFVLIHFEPAQQTSNRVRLLGYVTVGDPAARARVAAGFRTGLAGSVPSGVTVTATYTEKGIAGVTNDSALTVAAAASAGVELGQPVIKVNSLITGRSEDFGSFQARVPGVFFFLGVSNTARGWNGYPHAPDYVADERSIGVGTRAMAAVIVDRLRIR
jgi:metal-dependent amidase/aminoacylase/carboxypeptidase family protein